MSRSFIATSSLAGLKPLPGDRLPVIEDASRLVGLLRDRAPHIAPLFASPLLARPESGKAGSGGSGSGGSGSQEGAERARGVSWYGVHDATARRLREVPGATRDQAAHILAGLLAQALTLRSDPELGPLLPALLTIPDAGSVMVAGGQPVLINWGLAPADLETTPEALRAHFDGLFGPLCGVTWPAESEPTPSSGVDTAGVAGAGIIGAAALGAAATSTASSDASPAAPFPGDTTPVGAAVEPEPAAVGPVGAVAAADAAGPWYARRGVVIGLAVALGLLILLLLWWLLWAPGGLLARSAVMPPPAAPQVSAPGVGDLHGPVLDGLRRERDRLRRLTEADACTPEMLQGLEEGWSGPLTPRAGVSPLDGPANPPGGGPGEGPGDGTMAAPRPALPPPADLAELPATPASRMTALARTLEYSVALVLGDSHDGLAMGTAFFVAPDVLVTNRHVVEDVVPGQPLAITSEALGGMRRARVVAQTASSDIGGPDFAILRLDAPEPAAVPLTVATLVEKLSRVVTAGYPGYIAQSDAGFAALLDGENTATPSMVFTSGEVSVVQRQPNGVTIVIHTADMSQGNSGGPLVDLCGRVVGVNTFIGQDDASGRRGLYSLSGGDLVAFLAAHGVTASQSGAACQEDGAPPAQPPEGEPEAAIPADDTSTTASGQ